MNNIFKGTISYSYVLDEAKEKYPGLNEGKALNDYIELQRAIEAQSFCPELSRIATSKRLVAQGLIPIFTIRKN